MIANSIWVVVADSNMCRIYHYSKKPMRLSLIKELNHPENKLRDMDITSSKPGRYQSDNSSHGTYSQQSDPKEIQIDNFFREIANELDHGRNIQAYENLIIITTPHMTGLLFKHINKNVKNLVLNNIEKDMTRLPESELLSFLNEHR